MLSLLFGPRLQIKLCGLEHLSGKGQVQLLVLQSQLSRS